MPATSAKRSRPAPAKRTRKSSATLAPSDKKTRSAQSRRAAASAKDDTDHKPVRGSNKSISYPGGISDEAVKRATGRDWAEWRKLLDADGAAKMKHADIAIIVHDKHGVGDWWSQMVTVGYEQMVGLREKHQKTDGYSVSGSRVICAAIEKLFAAFEQPGIRRKWLPDAITIRKATPCKSMRIAWADGKASVAVNFYSKPGGKSSVQVQHDKFPTAASATKMKTYWSDRLDALRDLLEG